MRVEEADGLAAGSAWVMQILRSGSPAATVMSQRVELPWESTSVSSTMKVLLR